MAREMRIYNTETRRWERWEVRPLRMPWEGAWTRMRWLARYARRHSALFPRVGEEALYDFDPDTLLMRDPKRERRQKRRDRRDRLLAKAADAPNSMVEMQKHIG